VLASVTCDNVASRRNGLYYAARTAQNGSLFATCPPMYNWCLNCTTHSRVQSTGANRVRPDTWSASGVSWLISWPR